MMGPRDEIVVRQSSSSNKHAENIRKNNKFKKGLIRKE